MKLWSWSLMTRMGTWGPEKPVGTRTVGWGGGAEEQGIVTTITLDAVWKCLGHSDWLVVLPACGFLCVTDIGSLQHLPATRPVCLPCIPSLSLGRLMPASHPLPKSRVSGPHLPFSSRAGASPSSFPHPASIQGSESLTGSG